MKIYHTETQEDYDALMVELEEQGCKWSLGRELSEVNNWHISEHLTCLRVCGSKVYRASLNYYKEEYPCMLIIKYKAKDDGSLMKPTKETSIVKEVIAYQINTKTIRVNSVIQYRERGKDWVRGLVKFVDKCSIKVVRSFGTNHSLSSTSIGSGDIEIKVEIY